MEKNMDLSIIIPVYNAEEYLSFCLDSVVAQKIENFEIICVNDGSNDKSLEILKKYNKNYHCIKIIDKPNGGVISARIAGYNVAKGKYIGWVDADDFVEQDMFKKLLSIAKKQNADMVYCNYNFYPNEVINKQKWYKPYRGIVDWQLIMNNTIQWNKIVKKEVLDQLEITTLFETMGEGCYGLVFINSKKIVSVDDCLYNYRVGHVSLSSNFNNISWYKKVVNRAKAMLEYVEEKKYDKQWINYYKYRYLYYNLILMIVSAYTNNRDAYLSAKKIICDEKLFSKIYLQFLKKSFSKIKYLYLKYIGSKSFLLMKMMTKILLK